MTQTTPAALQSALTAGQDRLRALLPALTEEEVRGPSTLPGWTRGHVLSHIEGVGLALARQARYARRGRLIDVYDGGRPARDAAIEAGHRRSALQFTSALAAALDEVEASWAAVEPGDWERPVRYRDGVLLDAGLAWWRELEIHTVDLELGPSGADWSPEFCAHAVEFLAARVPEGVRLTWSTPDGAPDHTFGSGAPVAVTGTLTDLVAWLAGRHPRNPPAGDPLPRLGPWP
ncbi:maleylpyruvate isomerase family mycothiol-dependent enzyme [Actinacidiphila acidipaludis]|uniref:maleylpyruvate isomerase family mycothiol-dependent enzyme n=1 Tax=Actinacidiphila acidipaludis TaxID=2873382 RepID=UPI0027E17E91|nr:maleylpyruvate isomerase family mycothiol-dependent enzyme [Streptomyces acidipaludis]